MKLTALVVAVLLGLSACASPNPAVTPNPTVASTPSPKATPAVTPIPAATSAPISRDDAIALAQKVVVAEATLMSASFGRFADVYVDSESVREYGADRVVWAVKFESSFTICRPDGSGCFSPRPGFTTVILDGYTGTWITTFSASPG